MKKLLAVAIICISITSCKKFLDTKVEDIIDANQYYQTESELNNALAGVYSYLAQDGTYGRNIPIELEMGNDEAQYNNRNVNVSYPPLYDCQSSTKIYSDCWTALYKGIGAANLLLANIDSSVVADNIKKPIKGEALFLRAFDYFQLVTRYGDVPLILQPNVSVGNFNIPRTPSLTIYNKIIDDMKAADSMLNPFVNGSHISQSAIDGIIARVYLKMAGRPLNLGAPMFDSARVWAKKVVTSGIHSLNPDYKQIFINHSSDKYDITYKESMWEIEFIGNNSPSGTIPPGSRFASQLAMRYTGADPDPVVVYGYGSFIPTGYLYSLYQKFPSDSIRSNWNIPAFTYSTNTTPRTATPAAASPWDRDCGKWKRDFELTVPKSRDWGPTNFPVLRYADVLLMLAEAELEMGNVTDAKSYLNQVRARAKAELITQNDINLLRLIIREERSRELCFEGLRKFDLIRWGTFNSQMLVCKNLISNSTSSFISRYLVSYNNVGLKDTLLPIPSSELSVNSKMTQNGGW